MCELGRFVTVKFKGKQRTLRNKKHFGTSQKNTTFWIFISRWWLKLVFEYPKENHISKSFQHQPLVHQVLKETHCVQCDLQLWKTRFCVLSQEWNLHFLASYAAYHPVFPSVSSFCSCVRLASVSFQDFPFNTREETLFLHLIEPIRIKMPFYSKLACWQTIYFWSTRESAQ